MKEVYAAHLLQNMEPSLLIFSCFLVTSFYFNAVQGKNVKPYVASLRKNSKDIFLLNLTTLGSWFSFFYAIKYIEPAVASTMTIAMGPLLTIILGTYLRPSSQVLKTEILASVGLFIAIIILGFITWSGKSSIGLVATKETVVGFIAAIVCGVCIVGNTFFGKRLNDQGWSAAKVMAARFFLLLIISGFMFFRINPNMELLNNHFFNFMIIAIFGTIIPLYCLQRGIEKTEPITVSLAIAIAPLFTFLIQLFDSRLSSSIYSFAVIIFVLFFISLGILSRYGGFAWMQERKS